jgi:restriction system protein
VTAPARTRRRPPTRRAAARRPTVRRRKLRRDVAFWVGLVALALFLWAVYWLAHHLLDTVLIGAFLAVVTAGLVVRERRRHAARILRTATLTELDAMDDVQFEYALRDLMIRDGCEARRVGGAGDLAADVLGRLPGRAWWQPWRPRRQRFLVQAKHYQEGNRVGSRDVQCVGGTFRTIHGADIAMVITTSAFTRAAEDYCQRAGIRTMSRHELAAWASRTGPAPWH